MTIDHAERHAPNSAESSLGNDLRQAAEIVEEAMAFSGINPDTAPVRYEAAQRAARYATFSALGLLDSVSKVPRESMRQLDKETLNFVISLESARRFSQRIRRTEIA